MGFWETYWLVLQNIVWILLGLIGFYLAYLAYLHTEEYVFDFQETIEITTILRSLFFFLASFLLCVFSFTFGLTCLIIVVREIISGVF